MFFQDLINIKVNILPNVMKELLSFPVLLDLMPSLLYLKNKHYFGLMEDTFYKLKNNFIKDGP